MLFECFCAVLHPLLLACPESLFQMIWKTHPKFGVVSKYFFMNRTLCTERAFRVLWAEILKKTLSCIARIINHARLKDLDGTVVVGEARDLAEGVRRGPRCLHLFFRENGLNR